MGKNNNNKTPTTSGRNGQQSNCERKEESEAQNNNKRRRKKKRQQQNANNNNNNIIFIDHRSCVLAAVTQSQKPVVVEGCMCVAMRATIRWFLQRSCQDKAFGESILAVVRTISSRKHRRVNMCA